MKALFFFLIPIILLASCAEAIDTDAKMYTLVEKEYSSNGTNLKKELNRMEWLLVKKHILKSKKSTELKKYLQFVAKHDSFPKVKMDSSTLDLIRSQLNFQPYSIGSDKIKKKHSEEFKASTFNAVLKKLESYKKKDRTKPAVIANSLLLTLDDDDYKKPLFRSLILTLIVEASFGEFRTVDEEFLIRREREKNITVPISCGIRIEERNIFKISVNYNEQVMARGFILKSVDDLSHKIIRYYRMNVKLNGQQSRNNMANRQYKGFNFPFYSNRSKKELQKYLEQAQKDCLSTCQMKGVMPEVINIKFKALATWVEMYKISQLSIGDLKEVHFQSQIQLRRKDEWPENMVVKVYKEINEAFNTLRNKESKKLFGESYQSIANRKSIFLNDINKLRLLETLFPKRIDDDPYEYPELLPPPVEKP